VLNIRLPLPGEKYDAQNERELRRQIELAFRQTGTATDSGTLPNAVEGYLYNEGAVLVAGDSDWVYVPFGFSISGAEIVANTSGTLDVEVWTSTYSAWSTFTKISASVPISLSGAAKAQPVTSTWTPVVFSAGTYVKFVATGTPATITKATVTLKISATAVTSDEALDGPYLSSSITDFTEAAQDATADLLVAGSGITITEDDAANTLTIATTASTGGVIGRDGSNSTSTVNPHLAAQTAIANMSAAFTLSGISDVRIDVSVRAWKAGGAVLSLYLDGALLAPSSGGGVDPPNEGWYMTTYLAERNNLQCDFTYIAYSMASGAHTVVVRSEASTNTTQIVYGERCVLVTILT
jgi:hypothetical protein